MEVAGQHDRRAETKPQVKKSRGLQRAYLSSANSSRNFCVARKSVFLMVFSVVLRIEATVCSFNPS
jgi:hypothetical protein